MHAVCLTPGSCALAVVDSFWGGLADAIRDAVGEMVTTLFAWWTTSGSLDLNQPLVWAAQHYVTAWVAVPIAVLAVMAAVAWGVLSGGYGWIADIGRGLLVFGVVATGSIPIVVALQDWSTELAKGLLYAVPTRDVGARIIGLLSLPGVGSPVMVIFWGSVMLIASAIQYLLMLFRDGAVLVLTVAIPVAAAGQFNRASLLWLPRLLGWLLAYVFLKPTAALIYYLGLSLIGEGQGIHALATGVCMMIAAIFALPAMLRLVSFATAAPHGGGSGALTGTATAAGVRTMATSGAQPADCQDRCERGYASTSTDRRARSSTK
jgi:hypothetical protein